MLVGALVLSAALAPAALPLLAARVLQSSGWAVAGEVQFDTVGRPRLVADVATAYRALPPAERARVVLLADNYGEAGAIDVLGRAWGLPHAYSRLNGYGWWGPPALLPGCRLVRPVRNDEGVHNEEATRAAIYLCGTPVQGWASIWPQLRHLSN